MVVPHDVDTQSIESHRLDHFYPVFPVLNGDPRVMNFTSINPFAHCSMARGIEVGFEWLCLLCGCNIGGYEYNESHESGLLVVRARHFFFGLVLEDSLPFVQVRHG